MEASEETNHQSLEEGSSTSDTPAASASVAPASASPPAATGNAAPASPVKKVTSTVKKTKPKKDPRRVAAGKRLAEFNRKACDGRGLRIILLQ